MCLLSRSSVCMCVCVFIFLFSISTQQFQENLRSAAFIFSLKYSCFLFFFFALVLVKATVIYLDTQASNQSSSLVLFPPKSYHVHPCFCSNGYSLSSLLHCHLFMVILSPWSCSLTHFLEQARVSTPKPQCLKCHLWANIIGTLQELIKNARPQALSTPNILTESLL